MRIDGLSSYSISPDTGSRSGTAVTPYRQAVREAEARREQPQPVSASQGLEQQAQTRKVEAGNASTASSSTSSNLPVAFGQGLSYQRPLSSRAAQALASYSSTASLSQAANDEPEVVGVDLYA